MNFFRSKLGILSVLVIAIVAVVVVWNCLLKKAEAEEPEGTFVWNEICTEVNE